MTTIPDKLKQVDVAVREAGKPQAESVRTILSWFNAQRRGYWVVSEIKEALRHLQLDTEPNFEHVHIDSVVQIRRTEAVPEEPASNAQSAETGTANPSTPPSPPVGGDIPDPVPRIGILASASRVPISIARDATVSEATTLMMLHGFSQLPVMAGERNVYGAISWRSLGSRRSLGRNGDFVRDCTEPVQVLASETPLFSAIGTIVANDYILVSDKEKRVIGIVTATDIGDQFRVMSEPYLLLGEIENQIRRLIVNRFSLEALRAVQRHGEGSQTINGVSDLTFGQYISLLEKESNWKALDLPLDRGRFIEQLAKVRDIRNDVMHFDPDAEVEADMSLLRDFSRFLQSL